MSHAGVIPPPDWATKSQRRTPALLAHEGGGFKEVLRNKARQRRLRWAHGKVQCRKEPEETDPNLGRYWCCCNTSVAQQGAGLPLVLSRDPHGVQTSRLLLEGCLLGDRVKTDPQPMKGFLLHSTAPSQRSHRAQACQPSAWHPPCCTPRCMLQSSTGQPHRRREKTGMDHTSKAWLQKGQELLPGPRFPSTSQPAKGYGVSPESSSDSALQRTCAAALRQPCEPMKKQAADDVASVPFCCSALLARKRLFQPPRRDPNLARC